MLVGMGASPERRHRHGVLPFARPETTGAQSTKIAARDSTGPSAHSADFAFQPPYAASNMLGVHDDPGGGLVGSRLKGSCPFQQISPCAKLSGADSAKCQGRRGCGMWGWWVKKARTRRAAKYLSVFPDDAAAVQTVLLALHLSPNSTARDAAEFFRGREIADEEWQRLASRWERTWAAIARSPKRTAAGT